MGNIDKEILIKKRKEFGKKLKAAREKAGYNTYDFQDLIGMNQASISKIEAGNWNYGVDTILTYTSYLGLEIELV